MVEANSNQNSAEPSPPGDTPKSGTRNWGWLLVLLLIPVIVIIYGHRANSPQAAGKEGIVWQYDYETALKLAQQQKKPVLLAFSAGWCPPCQKMKRETYVNAEVVNAVQSFVCIMIDTDKQADLADEYGVTSIPTYTIIKPDSARLASFGGYLSPQDFVAQLRAALEKFSS